MTPLPRAQIDITRYLLAARLHRRAQIVGLERRTARGVRDSVDHAPGAHDDVANAANSGDGRTLL
jgi:hypothetical protein